MTTQSQSVLRLEWQPPDINEERWEFFDHPAKQPFYRQHQITWESLGTAAAGGNFLAWPRGECCGGVTVRLSYSSYDDYLTYLRRAPRNYRLNYQRMEQALQSTGMLILPAPIVLFGSEEGLLFSGWRRLCLAWNYGMVPYIWAVRLRPGSG